MLTVEVSTSYLDTISNLQSFHDAIYLQTVQTQRLNHTLQHLASLAAKALEADDDDEQWDAVVEINQKSDRVFWF